MLTAQNQSYLMDWLKTMLLQKKIGNFVYVIHCLLTIGMFECMSDACYFHLTVNLAGLALTAIQAGDNTKSED